MRKIKINQIPLSYKNKEEIKKLLEKLGEIGYQLFHGLDDLDKIEEHIVAICVDNKEKVVFQSNVTCMACWCTAYKRRPLSASVALENFDKLLIEEDLNFYKKLLKRNKRNG